MDHLSSDEWVALQALLELGLAHGGHFSPWGRKQRLSTVAYSCCNSAVSPPPCDLLLGSKLKFKVERKLGVHNPSKGKSSKKKTLTKLEELFIGLSSEKEEMEKEKEKLFNRVQSLRDMNKFLKCELALKMGKKRQHQLQIQSPTFFSDITLLGVPIGSDVLEFFENLVKHSPSIAIMDWHSSVERILHYNHISQ